MLNCAEMERENQALMLEVREWVWVCKERKRERELWEATKIVEYREGEPKNKKEEGWKISNDVLKFWISNSSFLLFKVTLGISANSIVSNSWLSKQRNSLLVFELICLYPNKLLLYYPMFSFIAKTVPKCLLKRLLNLLYHLAWCSLGFKKMQSLSFLDLFKRFIHYI